MIKILVFLCSLCGGCVREQKQETRSVTIVNGVEKKCQICGRNASCVRVINGKEEVYCWKHFNGSFK